MTDFTGTACEGKRNIVCPKGDNVSGHIDYRLTS